MSKRFFILYIIGCFCFSLPIFAQSLMRGFGQPNGGGMGSSGTSTVNSSHMQNGGNGNANSGSSASGASGGMGGVSYQVHILGQVHSPGTYRVPPSTRLDEGINYAGGILERGSRRLIEVRRGGHVKHYDILEFQRFGEISQNPFLLDNDVIFVPYAQDNVDIRGAIKSNGIYELTAEKNLWALIQLSGGFTVGVSEQEPITVVRFVHGEKTLLKVPNVEQELKSFALQNGDIVVIPHVFGDNRKFDYNFSELPADNVFFPTQATGVYVVGEVASPGAYSFNPTYTLRDYIAVAAPKNLAKPKSAYVMTRDGKHIKKPEKNKNFHLSPGDTIVVPERQITVTNALTWYNTLLNTVFSYFALRELAHRF